MSNFEVKVVKIDNVVNHPNADRLSLVQIGGYNCIANKLEDGTPRYKAGDLVVYIPEQAILPDWLLKKMGFWDETNQCGTLSGSGRNRVKIIKLRGEYSQGILYKIEKILDPMSKDEIGHAVLYEHFFELDGKTLSAHSAKNVNEGDDLSEILGIKKYEPHIPTQMRGVLGALFGFTKSYDIESLQKYPNVFEDGEEVVMTEKVHGTLCELGFVHETELPDDKKEVCVSLGNGWYCFSTSKGLAKSGMVQKASAGNEENVYFKTLMTLVNSGKAKEITDMVVRYKRFYIFGEVFGPGVQKGYSYNQPTPTFRVFDVYFGEQTNGGYMNDLELTNFCIRHGLDRVPVLYKGPFNMNLATEMRDGKTVAGSGVHIREGCVIRTVEERYDCRGLPDNRAQVKFVSPEYLIKSDGEEIN